MNFRTKIRELIKALLENLHEKRKIILVLSCFVVFITTYMLILPAFTLDKEEAEEQGGIDVPAVEESVEIDAAQTEDVAIEEVEEAKETEEQKAETSPETDAAKPAAASESKSVAPSKVTLQNDKSNNFVVAVEGKDAGLSDDMSVAVREIDQSDKKQKEEYESLYNDALEAVQKAEKEEGLEKPSDFAFAKFYDISLMDGGDEVEPDSAVDVKISFGKALQKELKVTDPDRVHIVHFAVDKDTGEVTPEVLAADTTDITVKNNKVTEAAFTADSFSVFALVYSQLTTNILTADGKTYKITVTYDDEAEIPDGTELVAKEIKPESKEYIQHLGKAWAEVNKDYLEQEEVKKNNRNGLDDYEGYEDVRPVNLDDARFFDVRLICGGLEIEPKTPVRVEIEYDDGLETDATKEEQVVGVAHYKTDVTEIISDVETKANEEGELVEFAYVQDSFSDIGTYVGQKTYDNVPFKMDSTLTMPLLKALSNSKGNGNGLKDIEAHKSLKNNEDGTYTMSLTVKGDSYAYEEYNKANILFVMDRSSSMTNNNVYTPYDGPHENGPTYYGSNDGGKTFFTLGYYGGTYYNGWTPYTGQVYTSVTRLAAEQAAMDVLIQDLLDKNEPDTPGKEDLIEISVISFADDRQSGNTEYKNWTSSDYDGLMRAINQTTTPSGTNWEDALVYAKEQADAKKREQPTEDVYVIFLTDGEPTAVYGETGNAHHYVSDNGAVHNGGFEFALTEDPSLYSGSAGIADGKNALDRAKEIVDDGYKFYGIFTFNPGVEQTKYLRRLMNFAYTGVDKAYEDDATQEDTDIVKKYFTNADTPETLTEAFEKIFADISNALGHGDVVITDGLQSADAMTTTIHADKADGFRYSVTDSTGKEMYYVTATGNDSNPTVTFHIGDQLYTTNESKQGVDGKPYYSVTVNGTEYKMALADLSGRELTWDLSAIGTLLPGCTYKVDIVVWPNQAAYDYVAGLNNNLPGYTWDSSVENDPDNYHEVIVDGVTYGYYTGGVSGHSSIVKYKDSGVFSVLTNTHQELNYSIVDTKTNEVTGETTTTSDPQEPISLEPQKPMDLVDTNSKIEKQWNVELDPSILEQLLYPADGKHYTLDFDIYQDTETNLYKKVTLGWDSTKNDYVWEKEFSIPTGLMLSETRMDALSMDKSAYPHGTYPVDPDDPNSELMTYYVLEDGHDYIIKERDLSFEFDFNADVFHPMLVDGKMQNVNFTKSNMAVDISNMTSTVGGLSSLKVENTLRGYIHLEKHVVDQNGVAIEDDKTKFEYTIVLTNEDALFEGTHIPWYGINGLYRHDKDFNYYEVYYDNNVLKLKDESGAIYPVVGTYDLSDVGEQALTYMDGEEEKELKLWGNLTTPSDGNKVASTTLQISQGELLSIANVPANTQYSIVESDEPGYELVSIDKRLDPNDVQEDPDATIVNLNESSIEGTIVPNHHNYISYANRCLVTDITIQKVDESGEGLEGAIFELYSVDESGKIESYASDILSVKGLEPTLTKEIDGREVLFHSAIETTGEIQKISGLPDGTYRLREKHVPAGYISTYKFIEFTISDRAVLANSIVTDTGDTDKLDFDEASGNTLALLTITNEPGAALPHTGGIGTTIFYVLGSILTIGCAIFLVSRRRIRIN